MGSICLIGMPGVGKSRIGVALAKSMGFGFLDTDKIMSAELSLSVDKIVQRWGRDGFLEKENAALLSIDPKAHSVISPGGSAIYCESGMAHVSRFSTVIYLADSVLRIRHRIRNLESRGIVWSYDGQDIDSLFKERDPLYRKMADMIYVIPPGFPRDPSCDAVAEDLASVLRRSDTKSESRTAG